VRTELSHSFQAAGEGFLVQHEQGPEVLVRESGIWPTTVPYKSHRDLTFLVE
jgi:hypothetical protein